MLKVSEILRVKGDTLYTASPDMPVSQAVQTMSEQDIGLVIMELGTLTGMLTPRDHPPQSMAACWATPPSAPSWTTPR